MTALVASYSGWSCHDCGRKYPHNGRRLVRFLALIDHLVITHRRLPRSPHLVEDGQSMPGTTSFHLVAAWISKPTEQSA